MEERTLMCPHHVDDDGGDDDDAVVRTVAEL